MVIYSIKFKYDNYLVIESLLNSSDFQDNYRKKGLYFSSSFVDFLEYIENHLFKQEIDYFNHKWKDKDSFIIFIRDLFSQKVVMGINKRSLCNQ